MFNLRNTKYSIIPMMLILMFGTRVTLAGEVIVQDVAAMTASVPTASTIK